MSSRITPWGISGFKLATSTHVLSKPDVYNLGHIPQALRVHCYLLFLYIS